MDGTSLPGLEVGLGTLSLIQIVFNIFFSLGLFVVIMRMNRAPKDDPRLSRGLQLLQSKIAVLEDLSDRTEVQVNQLAALLEQKSREVQAKIQIADQHVQAIRVAMDRSLEVAKIFQDKIPHHEIIERQNTLKYVKAARLAHQGLNADEIATTVDLPQGEIEFISKVNRDQLVFSEEQLPWWAKDNPTSVSPSSILEGSEGANGPEAPPVQRDPSPAEFELLEQQKLVDHLSRLQQEMQNLDMHFTKEAQSRKYLGGFEAAQMRKDPQQVARTDRITPTSHIVTHPPRLDGAIGSVGTLDASGAKSVIRRVEFPRIASPSS